MKDEQRFIHPSPEEWRIKAAKDLRTEDLDSILDWQPFKGITMGAYYDLTDLETTDYLTAFFSSLSFSPWQLLEPVHVTDAKSGNQQALEGLNNGAAGVLFQLDDTDKVDAKALFKGILPQHCMLAFSGTSADQYAAELVNQQGKKVSDISGFVINGKKIWMEAPKFKSIGLQFSNDFDIIPSLVEYLENLAKYLKIYGEKFLGQLNISYELGHKYFQNLVVARTLRWLTYLFAKSRNLDVDTRQVHIHAYTIADDDYKSAMLKNATSGVSAILGGVQSVHFDLKSPKPGSFNQRIARNAGNLMRDESKLVFEQDPMAGAYFVELLTHIISEQSWNQFEKKS